MFSVFRTTFVPGGIRVVSITNELYNPKPTAAIHEPGIFQSPENWGFGCLILTAGAIRCILAFHSAANGLFDDAYASLRYASNLVHGQGFVFNPGERVLGTTSPLHTVILAALGKVFGITHLVAITVILAVFASLGLLYCSERLLRRVGIPVEVKWTYLCVLAFLPSFLANTSSGMETPLVLFLMSVSIYLAVQDRLTALAIVGILLFLARVDTGLWLLALGGHILLIRGRPLRRLVAPLVIFLTGVISWLVFSRLYFGSIVPESIVGKAMNHGAFDRPDWNYVLTILSAFVPGLRFGAWGFIAIAIAIILMIPSTVDLWNRYHDLRPMISFVPLYVAAFLFARAPLFSWYVIPPKWAFYLVAVYSAWWWAARASNLLRDRIRPAVAMAVISLCVIVLGLSGVIRTLKSHGSEPWSSISQLIQQDVRSDGRIFLEHIGLIGFETGRYVYDYGGLVTPQTNRLKRQYGSGWLTRALRQYQADVVILYDTDLPFVESRTDADATWFRSSYDHVKDYRTDCLIVSVFFLKSSDRVNANPPNGVSENVLIRSRKGLADAVASNTNRTSISRQEVRTLSSLPQ